MAISSMSIKKPANIKPPITSGLSTTALAEYMPVNDNLIL